MFIFLLFCMLQVRGAENNLISKRASISFENADITVAIKTANGIRVAEAFNATAGAFHSQKMRWVSFGLPRLLARTDGVNEINSSNLSPFDFVPGGFYAYIETLSESVAAELAKEARVKYDNNSIEPSQFLPIDKHIGKIGCYIDLFDTETKDFTRIIGSAEIIANPVVVFFRLTDSPSNYETFLKNRSNPVIIKCNVESRARVRKQNVLTISAAKIEELNLKESLFGDAPEKYVTRNQLMELARRIHKSLHIEEEYEIREERFKTEFVESLISLASGSMFEQIDIATELQKLSHFAIDVKEDLKPDLIYKHLNNVFTVNTTDGREHIVLKNDLESTKDYSSQHDVGVKLETSGLLKKIIGVSASAGYFYKHKDTSRFKNSSVSDQLKTLNKYAESDVKWERDGKMIYPKSLSVTRIYRSTFEHSMTFSRIYKLNEEAAFNELISVSTENFRVADIFFNLSNKIACSSALFESSLTNSLSISNKIACAQFSKPRASGFQVFNFSAMFLVPHGVTSLRVLAVGGGAGGGSGFGGGGGSGYVEVREVTVSPFDVIAVSVGRGGAASQTKYEDNRQTAAAGQPSLFGSLVRANGGTAPGTAGGAGGSGGGGTSESNGQSSGDGGTNGGNGGNSNYYGGRGQGTFSSSFSLFQSASFAAGSGGSGGNALYVCGGGGGGGVLMNGNGPSGGDGAGGCASGGRGFGAGGAGGYFDRNSWHYGGGNGADGLVYVEWSG